MQHFTPESDTVATLFPQFSPSEATLNLIRQIAYTYRVVNIEGKDELYCLN